MLKTLNTAATGMTAQNTNMDTVAHNIANVSTVGFKRARAEFEDLLYQTDKDPGAATGLNAISPTGVQVGLGVRTASVQKDFSDGAAQVTKQPFDLMIEGRGFFPVQMGNGSIAYTRDGAFKKSADGTLVDKNGNLLTPQVQIPPDATGVEISADGQIRIIQGVNSEPVTAGQIQLVGFVNPAGLRAIGRNLFVPTPASGAPQQAAPGQSGLGLVSQGQLEMSNVNIVDEMVNMIKAQRAYETNSKVVQAADQMLQNMNNLR